MEKANSVKPAFIALLAVFSTACPKPAAHTPGAPSPRAGAHSAYLTWTASTTPNVTYNVYRYTGECPGTGAFTKINAAPVPNLQYTDTTVEGGKTYCYYVTAWLQSSNPPESVPSNKSGATVPGDQPNPPTGLTVEPATADLRLNEQQQFTARRGEAPAAPAWTIEPAEGAISANGLYTAPAAIKGNNVKVVIRATDGADSATAQVTLRKN